MAAKEHKKYSLGNSHLPMMFRRSRYKKGDGQVSRSLENLVSVGHGQPKAKAGEEWEEVVSVRTVSPVVMCILPPVSADFVCSALLAVGATPLLTDDLLDVEKNLRSSKAVVVDVGAPQALVEELIEHFPVKDDQEQCLVLSASQVGSNDRKKQLALQVIEECGPALVTGMLGDIYALGQAISEKSGSDSDADDSPPPPGLHIHMENGVGPGEEPALSRRSHWRRQRDNTNLSTRDASPHTSPRSSPRASPRMSPHTSPRQSLACSPIPAGLASFSPRHSPKGVRRRIKERGRKIGRTPTLLPRVTMKGQFQEDCMSEVNVDDALHYGQTLAAYTRATVHLYETSVITNGETIVEITNPQFGVKKSLHSLLPCSAAIAAACFSSVSAVTEENEGVSLRQFTHALALWYVATEEASSHANQRHHVLPGTLRQTLIDALSYLEERHVRAKAGLKAYTAGKPS